MSGRERWLVMVLGLVAVVAAALSIGQDGGDPTGVVRTVLAVASPSLPTSPDAGSVTAEAMPGGRDPFEPRIPGVTPSPTPSPATPTVSPPPPPTEGGTVIGGHRVIVNDVFVRGGLEFVQVSVDAEVFTVREGEAFAGGFEVLGIQDPCATFAFGDAVFEECEQEVGK